MKVIDSQSERFKILSELIEAQEELMIWQVSSSGHRAINSVVIQSFQVETGLVHFKLNKNFPINANWPLYFYSEKLKLIFKSDSLTSSSIRIPTEIKILQDSEVVELMKGFEVKMKIMTERSVRDQDFLQNEFEMLDLDDEDKMYADKRESPRARAKSNRWVKIRKKNSLKLDLCRIFDLSRGGLGFLTISPTDYPKGMEVFIVGFDEFDLDDPLHGEIVSQRPTDDSESEFKVGIKFIDGQD
ncbi:MAG: PilZ domain-containing protein [Bacteriovoracaceae bacterium]